MWPFMRPKPRPPKPPAGCVNDIEAYRVYAMSMLEGYYKQICQELANTDPESLAKLNEILNRYNETEANIDKALELMTQEIQALRSVIGDQTVLHYVLEPQYYPATQNLTFHIKEVE